MDQGKNLYLTNLNTTPFNLGYFSLKDKLGPSGPQAQTKYQSSPCRCVGYAKGYSFIRGIPQKIPMKSQSAASTKRLFPCSWLQKYNNDQLERLAVLTIDGGLTDDEAEQHLRTLEA